MDGGRSARRGDDRRPLDVPRKDRRLRLGPRETSRRARSSSGSPASPVATL